MRTLVFNNNFSSKKKCGAEVGAIGALSSLGIVSSGLEASASKAIANKQIAAQKAENQLTRDWNTQEAEKSRQFQKEMIDYQNEYNLPVNQVQRLQDANVNSALAMTSGSTQSISASPSSSPQASGSMGLSPVSQQPLDLQIPQMSNAVASMLTGVANAKKAGVETSWLEKSMDLNLRNLSADASLKEVTAAGLKLDNALKDQSLPPNVRKAYAECQKATYDAIVSQMTVGKVENEAALVKSQEKLNSVLSELHGTQNELLKLDIATYIKRLNSTLHLQAAQTQDSVASAAAKRSQINVNNSLSKLFDIKSRLDEVSFAKNKATLKADIQRQYVELKHAGLINKELERDIDRNLGRWTWENAKNTVDLLQQVVNLVHNP